MLNSLHVKNLALIEEADMEFARGLNIITGETGAGKSILIGSINAALGNKVSADFVRNGADYGLVELQFHVENPQTIAKLKALDVADVEDGDVLISRKIIQGRSTIKVNGEAKVASEVRAITSLLIDIHGQHEHHSLMNKSNYLAIIDKYAKEELKDLKKSLKDAYHSYLACRQTLEEYQLDPESLRREISFMEFETNEIEEADLKIGEDVELEKNFQLFHNSRKILEGVYDAMNALSEKNENATDSISHALRAVHQVLHYDEERLSGILSQLSDLEDILNGLNADLRNYTSDMNFDEENFHQIEERLSRINELKQKYGKTIPDILEYYDSRIKKLEQLQSYEENKEKASQELLAATTKVLELCEQVTKIRKNTSLKLSEAIKKALLELNFLDVSFETQISVVEHFNENGNNEADFLISTNPGEPMKPISKVASGGELSRIMLAIKTVLSDKDEIDTLIFDEIDTGISGRTAQMVAVKLGENSQNHQVLCITHLPQIAARADEHFMIEKNVIENKTITSIQKLDEEHSVRELARLLGGEVITDAVLANAKELKEQYR